jgi:MFS transporter, MHS family, proline/betaine transporter
MIIASGDLAGLRAEPIADHAPPAVPARRVIAASLIGNIMEWYDFAIYGYFAVTIGANFFPVADPISSTLAAFAVFAVGFLARPLGGVLFGHVGDRIGRKRALTASVALMAVPTVLIGLLPPHAQIGALAGAALVVLRLLQAWPSVVSTPARSPTPSSTRTPSIAAGTVAGWEWAPLAASSSARPWAR